MYNGELFCYGVGIDAPREVASGTCAREFLPNHIRISTTITYI